MGGGGGASNAGTTISTVIFRQDSLFVANVVNTFSKYSYFM